MTVPPHTYQSAPPHAYHTTPPQTAPPKTYQTTPCQTTPPQANQTQPLQAIHGDPSNTYQTVPPQAHQTNPPQPNQTALPQINVSAPHQNYQSTSLEAAHASESINDDNQYQPNPMQIISPSTECLLSSSDSDSSNSFPDFKKQDQHSANLNAISKQLQYGRLTSEMTLKTT